MGIPEKILEGINELPEVRQLEVLDFVEYLKLKTEKQEYQIWSDLSIASALKDMIDEPSMYSMEDLKEEFL